MGGCRSCASSLSFPLPSILLLALPFSFLFRFPIYIRSLNSMKNAKTLHSKVSIKRRHEAARGFKAPRSLLWGTVYGVVCLPHTNSADITLPCTICSRSGSVSEESESKSESESELGLLIAFRVNDSERFVRLFAK